MLHTDQEVWQFASVEFCQVALQEQHPRKTRKSPSAPTPAPRRARKSPPAPSGPNVGSLTRERPLQHSRCGSSRIVHPWGDLCNAAVLSTSKPVKQFVGGRGEGPFAGLRNRIIHRERIRDCWFFFLYIAIHFLHAHSPVAY